MYDHASQFYELHLATNHTNKSLFQYLQIFMVSSKLPKRGTDCIRDLKDSFGIFRKQQLMSSVVFLQR